LCSLISPLGKCKIHFPVVVFIRFLVFRVRVERVERRTQDLGTALAGCNGVRWNGRVGGEVKQLVVRFNGGFIRGVGLSRSEVGS